MSKTLAIRWFEEVWNQRRQDVIDPLIQPDVKGHLEGGVEIMGKEQFIEWQNALLAAFPDIRVEVIQSIEEGDFACVLWRATGVHSGDGFGFAATHRPVDFRGTTWFRFSAGRIAEAWDCWNQGDFLKSLG